MRFPCRMGGEIPRQELGVVNDISGNVMAIGKLGTGTRLLAITVISPFFSPRVKEVGRHQIAALVVRVHEAVRDVDQNGEAGGEDHQLARYIPVAESRRLSRHAAGIGSR